MRANFQTVTENIEWEWNEQSQEAFNKIKKYLSNLLVLELHQTGIPLLYMTVNETATWAMLAQHLIKTRKDKAIFYINKKFSV